MVWNKASRYQAKKALPSCLSLVVDIAAALTSGCRFSGMIGPQAELISPSMAV